ncbi:ras-responsive element-binding protein 1-like isoform X2 [Ischnura elegans]|nr:ras-responsive element-binding protein 1-like isoform X2 [Ischnura elegans]
MEITSVEKEEEKVEEEMKAVDEGDAEVPKVELVEEQQPQAEAKEEDGEAKVPPPLKEEVEEERGGPVTRHAAAAKPPSAEPESNLIGARKRKSNKVVKREVEPRVEVVKEIVDEVMSESVVPEEPKQEEESVVAEEEPEPSAPVPEIEQQCPEVPAALPEEEKKTDAKAPKGDEEEDMRYVCPICEDVLSSQHLFTVHIRSHNTPGQSPGDGSSASAACATSNGLKAFSCRICGKALSSSSSLDRHMLVHSGERPFKCRLCGVAFTTNGNMHRHMRTHATNPQSVKEPEEVSDCGSSDSGGSKRGKVTPKKSPAPPPPTTTPSPGNGRKRTANGNAVEAPSSRLPNRGVCSPRTRTAKESSEMGWRCLPCDTSFKNQRALRVHAYMVHRELEPEDEEEDDFDDEDYEEEERGTGRKRTRRAGEREERSQPHQTPTLGFQDLTFVDFSTQKFPLIANAVCEMAVHRASSEFHRFQCGRCDRAFPCGSALHIHADTRHRASSTSPATAAPPAAEDPKEDFFAVLNLQNKTRQCGTSPPPPTTTNQSATLPPHNRLFPHSNSPSLSHLPYAERKRREEEFDNAFYFNSPAMKPKDLHLGMKKASKGSEADSGREPSDAPKDLADISSIISAVAGNGSDFMKPMEEEEEDEIEGGGYEEEEEEQEEEDAAFVAELREMKMRGEFPCKLCPSVFPNLRALKGHCRNHIVEMVEEQPGDDDGDNKYACCLCGRRVASDKHGLMRHLRSHNGERPFRCALCRYAFTTKANCERHLRNRHSKVSREEVRRSVIYSPVADDGAVAYPDNPRDFAEKSVNPRLESAFASSSTQCTPPRIQSPPTKLSALLTAISEAKSYLTRTEQFNKDHSKDEKPKIGDRDAEKRMINKQGGHMDDLSSVEELVNFAKSPSLPAPLTMVSGQLTLPMHQHLYRPIAVKQELVKEAVPIGAEAPLDLSMDALDLSSKKVQDEPEDLSRPSVGKLRTNLQAPPPSSVGSFNGGLLMPARLPSVPITRPMAPPPTTCSSHLSPPMLKVESTPVSISNGVPKMEIPMSTPPSQPPFYPNSLHMYLNSQYPTGPSTPTRPPVGNFPYLLPLPFPSSGASLITQLQPTQVQSPSLHPSPLISPSVTQTLSSQTVPSYPGIPTSCAPPTMERLEKEILRNLQLSSGGTLVLDPAAMNERIQALALAAATAVGFPSTTPTSEAPSKPVLSQAKESKPNDQPVTTIREATPSKEDNRMQSGVKMVIKNGVLMPKQKQRRYRTERPFACCHCSARFTLRSNMERHIKQQHPEFWSQRPRGGRRGGSGGLPGLPSSRTDSSPSASDARLSHSPDGPLPPAASLPAESAGKPGSEHGSEDYRDDDINMDDAEETEMLSPHDDRVSTPESSTNVDDPINKAKDNNNKKVISEEVKNAIAQQLKSKLVSDCRANSSSFEEGNGKRMDSKNDLRKSSKDKVKGTAEDEDSGELVIDEEKMDTENDSNADKGKSTLSSETKEDESSGVDLASVSKLLDNASTQTFQQYFRSEEDDDMEETEGRGSRRGVDEGYDGGEDGEDEEEEEGWKSGDETGGSKCASSGEEGSVRGANRGRADDRDDSLERKLANVTVEAATAADTEDKGKRRSAYSSAPNRVSCPYCMRKFPWRSSLRRHILTHTGQKPYKCAHCPLLFTTKSNCDRHLLRKHGRGNGGVSSGSGGCGGSSSGAEDSASVVSSSGAGGLSPGGSGAAASSAYTMRNVPERPYKCSVCPSSTFSTQNNLKKHLATKHHHLQPPVSGNQSGRLSTSPRGGSDKGGSLSSASSPRCATEERDVDDEEDEEGLVGAEDEEGMLDEEEDEEEEDGEFEEDEESADCSAGDILCNGESHPLRNQSNPMKKKDPAPPQSLTKTPEKAIPELQLPTSQNKHQLLNGNLPLTPVEEGEQVKLAWDKGRTPPLIVPVLPSHPVQLPPHHQQQQHHHHHHPGSDLPFKCHLCERSYAERNDALNHIKEAHASEYELLVAKGALDSANAVASEDAHNSNHHNGPNNNNTVAGGDQTGGEESLEQLRGKFPDYANRKVVCAFCMRRFWSAEDLRRHMRTHTGERPFSCDICARRFTLKHSMLRHRKKHSNAERAAGGNTPVAVATSEASDEETITTRHRAMASDLVAINHLKWEKNVHGGKDDNEAEGKRKRLIPQQISLATAIGGVSGAGDLIEKLLDIQDKSIIEKMLLSKSADDAAKLLGVDGHD